jgi:hypothetical protein
MKNIILTISITLIISFLMLTSAPVYSQGVHCKILPNTQADRDNYCPDCGQWTETCPKNDCACAKRICLGWISNLVCDFTQKIVVCGGVCNDASAMEPCVNSLGTASAAIASNFANTGFTSKQQQKNVLTNFKTMSAYLQDCPVCELFGKCGKVPYAGVCTSNSDCLTNRCGSSGTCAKTQTECGPCGSYLDCFGRICRYNQCVLSQCKKLNEKCLCSAECCSTTICSKGICQKPGGGGGGRFYRMGLSDSEFYLMTGGIILIILVIIYGASKYFAKKSRK